MSRDFVTDRPRDIRTITGGGLTAQIRGLASPSTTTPSEPGIGILSGIGIGTLVIGAIVLFFLLRK